MQKGNSKKVDLLEHFKPVFQKIKDTKFFEEFFTSNIQQIKRKNEEVLDKLSDKFVTCIALIQNQYDLEDSAFSNVLSIVETVFSNTKRKIGYILLLKPILQYLINIVEKQKNSMERKMFSASCIIVPVLRIVLLKKFSKLFWCSKMRITNSTRIPIITKMLNKCICLLLRLTESKSLLRIHIHVIMSFVNINFHFT